MTIKRPLEVIGFNRTSEAILVQNNGHNVRFVFVYENNDVPILTGGPLSGEYELTEMHFHFGLSETTGSEHSIDGVKYVGEEHVVFKNIKYETSAEALLNNDGFAVLTRFLTLGLADCVQEIGAELMAAELTKNIEAVTEVSSEFLFEDDTFSLLDVFGDLDFDFYSYNGGLTSPGCQEAHTFIIADETLEMRLRDYVAFLRLQGVEKYIVPNLRPIQDIGTRKVFYYHH